ncbi:MAG: hypothetical protein U5L00_06025 [Desulfovermiculus sp.]|nr:hypothetical protein [Desulfovermiculus sp.]
MRTIPGFCTLFCFGVLLQALVTPAPGYCDDGPPLAVEQYTFHPLPEYGRMETVCFHFSQVHLPRVNSLEGDRPRLYFDLQPVLDSDLQAKKSVNGALVHSIRSFLHRDENSLRVVLDLSPDFNYRVEQRFSEMDTKLCLIIQAEE